MTQLAYTYVLTNGTTADADQVMTDLNEAKAVINAGIDTANIVDNAITTAKILNDAVTQAKIGDDAVGAPELRDDAVTDANRAVTTNHIRDDAVTAAKIAPDTVGSSELANDAVDTAALQDDAVTSVELRDDAVTDANRAVTTDHIRDSAVTTPKLGAASVTAAKRAAVPNARVRRATNQSIPDDTATAITFSTEEFDGTPDNMFELAAPTRLTIVTAGLYLIGGQLQWAPHADGVRICSIRVDGGTTITTAREAGTSGTFNHDHGVTTLYRLTAGQYIELIAHHTRGAALNALSDGVRAPVLWAAWQGP